MASVLIERESMATRQARKAQLAAVDLATAVPMEAAAVLVDNGAPLLK